MLKIFKTKRNKIWLGVGALIAPLAPIATVLSCGESDATPAALSSVLAEQKVVNALVSTGFKATDPNGIKPVANVDFASAASRLGFANFKSNDKFTYTMSHPYLGTDGTLAIKVVVADKTDPKLRGDSAAAPINVQVDGITAEQVKATTSFFAQNFTGTKISMTDFNRLNVAPGTRLNSAGFAALGFPEINLPYPILAVTVEKSSATTPTTVKFTLPGSTSTIDVQVTKFDLNSYEVDQLLLRNLVSAGIVLENPLAATNGLVEFTPQIATSLGFFGLLRPGGDVSNTVRYSYRHPGISATGTLMVELSVATGTGITVSVPPAVIPVPVKIQTLQEQVNEEQERVNNFHVATPITRFENVQPKTDATFTVSTANDYDLDTPNIRLPLDPRFDYTFSHGALSANGDLPDFKITVRAKGHHEIVGTPKVIVVPVVLIPRLSAAEVAAEQAKVSALTSSAPLTVGGGELLASEFANFGTDASILGFNTFTPDERFFYAYSHERLVLPPAPGSSATLSIRIDAYSVLASGDGSLDLAFTVNKDITVNAVSVTQADLTAEMLRIKQTIYLSGTQQIGTIPASFFPELLTPATAALLGIQGFTPNANDHFDYYFMHMGAPKLGYNPVLMYIAARPKSNYLQDFDVAPIYLTIPVTIY